jgi:hypothetical protein
MNSSHLRGQDVASVKDFVEVVSLQSGEIKSVIRFIRSLICISWIADNYIVF